MAQAESSSSQNQNGEPGHQTSKDYIKSLLSLIPKERKPKIVWIIVCCLVAIGTLVYGMIYNTEEKFHEDNDLCTKKVQSNTSTDTCYRRVEKKTYPVIVNLGFVLLGIIVGRFIYFVCIIAEELRQFKRCYDRKICKLFEQCMTGISWKPAIAVGVIVVIAVGVAKEFTFELGDMLKITGSIGVSPVVSYLLNLDVQTQDVQTEVDCSRNLEENGLYPAYTLAWNYYTNYLKEVLPIFIKRFSDSNTPVQDQEGSNERSDRDARPKKQLSSKKLIVLLSHNYKKDVKLVDLDNNISEITRVFEGGYEFPLYRLKHNGKEYQYVIQYADEPLETLQSMCNSEGCKPVHADQLEDQVKLLCRTLSEMLIKDGYYRNMCTFILITEVESLQNGGLVKIIMSYVGEEKRASNTKKPIKSPTKSAMVQPQAQETDDTSDVPCCSTIVDIDNIEGSNIEEQYNTDGYFIPADDQDENITFFGEEKEGISKRDKDLVNPKLQTRKMRAKKCKPSETIPLVSYPDKNVMINNRKQSTSMLSKEQAKENAREVTSPPVSRKGNEQQQPTFNKAISITIVDTPALPPELENEEPLSQIVDEDVRCPNETESEERCGTKFDLTDGKGSQDTVSICAVDGKETCPKEIVML